MVIKNLPGFLFHC